MPNNRSRKVEKESSYLSSKRIMVSRHRPTEVTHILLRELSTQKIVSIETNSLSDAARMKPLTSGRIVSFRNGNVRGQKQGEILIVGTHDEVSAEMNNYIRIDTTESPQKRRRQDYSPQKNCNDKYGFETNSSISLNVVEAPSIRPPSPLQALPSQDYAFRLPTPTLTTLTTTTTNSNSLISNSPITTNNETSMKDVVTDAPVITQPPAPCVSSPLISTTPRNSIKQSAIRTVVPSTTITRNSTAGEALREIKRLQLLVQSKDDEISKLTEQVKKLKEEVEKHAKASIVIPTDNIVIQWVDYLYESIHKDEIRNQLNFDIVADELGIEPETLNLCLELSNYDRISTARQLFKQCINYDELIQKKNCWQDIDDELVVKICRFVREFFGVHAKFTDTYIRDSLGNMMRKDSWKIRNPDKAKRKIKQPSSTNCKTSSKQGEEIPDNEASNIHHIDDEIDDVDDIDDEIDVVGDIDDDHF